MSNKTYDILKFVAQIVLPALATCIVAIFTIWSIPYGESIGATLMAVDTLLGAILHGVSKNYIPEENEVDEDEYQD